MRKGIIQIPILLGIAGVIALGAIAIGTFRTQKQEPIISNLGAYGIGWNATSTTGGYISPNRINGVEQTPYATAYVASSTTATSTFAGDVRIKSLIIGDRWMPNTNYFDPQGFFGTPSLFQVSYSAGDITGMVLSNLYGNGPYAPYVGTPIIFANASTTPGGVSSTNYAAINFSGPQFSAYSGLPINSLATVVTDGANVSVVATTTASKAYFAWGVGPGYTTGNYDMVLKTNTAGTVGLGVGTTTLNNMISIYSPTKSAIGFSGGSGTGNWTTGYDVTNNRFSIANSIALGTTDRFVISSTGNVGIGTVAPLTKLSVESPFAVASTLYPIVTTQAASVGATLGGIYMTADVVSAPVAAGLAFQVYKQNTGLIEAVRISNSGNVGIGTTSPWGRLSVTGNGTDAEAGFVFADSNNAPKVIITNQGNVGIGTTAPGSIVHVLGSTPTIQIDTNSDSTAEARLGFTNVTTDNFYSTGISSIGTGGGTGGGSLAFLTRSGGSGGWSNMTERMRILSTGNVGIGTTSPWGRLSVTGNGTGAEAGFVFADSNNAPKVIITNQGNVGIGTTNPTQKLEVNSAVLFGVPNVNEVLIGADGNVAGHEGLSIYYDTGGAYFKSVDAETAWKKIFVQSLDFQVDAGGSTGQFIVKSGGNVGIGTTSPLAKLSVQNTAGALTNLMTLASSTTSTKFEIRSDGTLRLSGDATTWEDLRFPATAINPAGAPGPMTFDATNLGFTAGAAGTTTIAIIAQMPHSWKQGSTIHPHIHWEPTTTDTGNVAWNISYKWSNINEVEPAATFLQATQAGVGTAYTHQLIKLPDITATGKTLSSILSIFISRGGASPDDTYTGDALLKEFDIHYEVNSLGSDSEFSKVE